MCNLGRVLGIWDYIALLMHYPLGTSRNPNRTHSIGVFLFFVPKMCPKCDLLGATFVLIASQKGGAAGKRTRRP